MHVVVSRLSNLSCDLFVLTLMSHCFDYCSLRINTPDLNVKQSLINFLKNFLSIWINILPSDKLQSCC